MFEIDPKGFDVYWDVQDRIIGRAALFAIDGAVIYTIGKHKGDHLEIGCGWGGSAIIAALGKQAARRKGIVASVDQFTGWYGGHDPHAKTSRYPTREIIGQNLDIFGVTDRVRLMRAKTPPLPKGAKEMTFSTCFIDGNHKWPFPWTDFEEVRNIVTDLIVFHDSHKPGVRDAVKQVVATGEWEIIFAVNKVSTTHLVSALKEPDKPNDCGTVAVLRRAK